MHAWHPQQLVSLLIVFQAELALDQVCVVRSFILLAWQLAHQVLLSACLQSLLQRPLVQALRILVECDPFKPINCTSVMPHSSWMVPLTRLTKDFCPGSQREPHPDAVVEHAAAG